MQTTQFHEWPPATLHQDRAPASSRGERDLVHPPAPGAPPGGLCAPYCAHAIGADMETVARWAHALGFGQRPWFVLTLSDAEMETLIRLRILLEGGWPEAMALTLVAQLHPAAAQLDAGRDRANAQYRFDAEHQIARDASGAIV